MKVQLPKKFTDRNLDKFIDSIYRNFKLNPTDIYYFDLTEVEFISNQELLVFSAILKSFVESKINFKVTFFKEGVSTLEINDRVKKQIIQFWNVWKIWQIVPYHLIKEYFGVDGNTVQRLQEDIDYYPKLSEMYDRHGVTPFVSLDYINNYNEIDVQEIINPIYILNSVIESLLNQNKCHHPFTSNSLSTIVTEELYLNFLDHSLESSLIGLHKMAFMSIGFQAKIDERLISEVEIQNRKKLNFQTECIEESIDFFYDKKNKKYKNNSYIQFSFLDFGQGIPSTLKKQYEKENKGFKDIDSDILKYSFNHNSSRHPIFHEKSKLDKYIPRGLFDALTIVRRYKGLLITRSNYGKILFDFSIEKDIEKAFSYFGDENLYFPGTLISLYLPAIKDTSKINLSTIKPEVKFSRVVPKNKKYININEIVENLSFSKETIYTEMLKSLKNIICDEHEYSLVFMSFKGCEIPKRIVKKIIYFLLTDYGINNRSNVVILNSPSENILNEIATEILLLNSALKNYKIHPLPIIDFDKNNEDLNVKWLGIYDDTDKVKLNELLYEQYSIARSDFKDPENVSGHLNEFDSYGNLISNFPNYLDIIEFYKIENKNLISNKINKLLQKHTCIKYDDTKSLYLCNGNYYQKEYVELNNLVNDKNDCNSVTQLLHDKIKETITNIEKYKFLSTTTTSHKLLKSLELQGLIDKEQYISLDNYHTFEKDLNEEVIDNSKKYILICDVISTGTLTLRLNERLEQLGTAIEYIAVVTSTLDLTFNSTNYFLEKYSNKIIKLHEYSIKKLLRIQLGSQFFNKKIIRINPHTNIPIRLSINETNYNESITAKTSINYSETKNQIIIKNTFLDIIDEENILVGFYKKNTNLIHPYFFNTDKILEDIPIYLLKDIFLKINNSALNSDKIQVFYPRKSGVDSFDFNKLKKVLRNQFIEEIEIERFRTPEGWRFPHNTDYLSSKIENNICFIFDDGSCSGDSLIQMIDEISFYDAKEIILLCFVGRVNDHMREFFSRISKIKVKDRKSIPISIYFVSHWHIPTYNIDENPNNREILWLDEIVNIKNTPQSIRKIANSIKNEIKPKDDKLFKDYKYLPRQKNTKRIPKKDLLLIREELGKVIGYRLYIESFIFFDYFISKYQKPPATLDHFKEIELLCAIFIFEPYLYEKMIMTLPDVTERIEDFVDTLIFSDNNIYSKLTYEWNKKDIVHLFFIVFKDEKLIKRLSIEQFKRLIKFTQQVDSIINYILFKLLKYFPLSISQFSEKRFDSKIKEIILKLNNDSTISNKQTIKFYNFIASLPSRDDFNSQLLLLKQNYIKLQEPEYHNDKISFGHNVSEFIIALRRMINALKTKNLISQSDLIITIKCWKNLLDFINPILSFSKSFEEFLVPYTYRELIIQTESIRAMTGMIEGTLFSDNDAFNDLEKLRLLIYNLETIQSYIDLNTTFHQVIEYPQYDLSAFIITFIEELTNNSFSVIETGARPTEMGKTINIPKIYVEKLLITELVTNIKKYSPKDKSRDIKLDFKLTADGMFSLNITNFIILDKAIFSKGEGSICFTYLANSPIFGFDYSFKVLEHEFVQILTFTLFDNGN